MGARYRSVHPTLLNWGGQVGRRDVWFPLTKMAHHPIPRSFATPLILQLASPDQYPLPVTRTPLRLGSFVLVITDWTTAIPQKAKFIKQ